jgi:GlpG protein
MPQCVGCGVEKPRDEMYGPPDELRCRACANRCFPAVDVPPDRAKPFRRPPVTIAVMAAAVAAFAVYKSAPDVGGYLVAEPSAIWDGQLWRLVTSVFPHGSILHLVFNLYWFWLFGKEVESWMRPPLFAGFVVATAVGSSAAQLLVGFTGAAPVMGGPRGIGLSGVVYALFGLLYALRRDKDFAAALMHPGVVQIFVAWFFISIALTYWKILGIANVAHGAGAVLGWLFGQAVLVRWRAVAVAGVSLLCVAVGLTTLYMPWDGNYDWHRADRYAEQKDYRRALEWYQRAAERLPDNADVRHNIRWAEQQLETGGEGDQ